MNNFKFKKRLNYAIINMIKNETVKIKYLK